MVNKKIAVLSGKGGTGKTLVSVNLAAVAQNAIYLDCDVEEPNGHLFWKPEELAIKKVYTPVPESNESICTGCRTCIDFCQYNALAYINNKVRVFEDVCHSCGGCLLVCPEKAIFEKYRSIGEIRSGVSGKTAVLTGVLNTGEASGIPIIHSLFNQLKELPPAPVFIDSPPGSACIVMESIQDADYCVLVAEPTLFGAHNLAMVHQLVSLFAKPFGVVLNKCMEGDNPSLAYCQTNNLSILGQIPFEKELGRLNSNGKIAVKESKTYCQLFSALLSGIEKEVSRL